MSEQPDKQVLKNELPHRLIKHIVVLMLENRGFDHLMGWLYDKNEKPHIITREGDTRGFIGLSGMSPGELLELANTPPAGSQPVQISEGARSPKTPAYNTGESFQHIMNQMWGVGLKSDAWLTATARQETLQKIGRLPNMKGYVLDYDLDTRHVAGGELDAGDLTEVMDTYRPEQVPVLSGLARNFAVSDEWFCSVPSQTNTNRAFVMTGTSRGLVNNSFYDPINIHPRLGLMRVVDKFIHGDMRIRERVKAFDFSLMRDIWTGDLFKNGKSHADALPASTRSIFEVLQQHNFTWKVYWQSEWPPKYATGPVSCQYTRVMIPLLQDPSFDDNFVRFDGAKPENALLDAIKAGDLPAFTWIEPKWGGGPQWNTLLRSVGNDMHPVSDTTVAEDFVASIYAALTASPKWSETLFVITFDENGGTYDHVLPPPAVPSGNDACPLAKLPIDRNDMDPQTRTQFGFGFDQYGIRVPTILISPCVPPGTIFRSLDPHVPFDHASLIATVLSMAEIDKPAWDLGDRVAHAPTFDYMLGPPQNQPGPAALSVPFERSTGAPLSYNTDYILEFVGSKWGNRPGRSYLGPQATGVVGFVMGWHYPTITGDESKAARIRLVPEDGSAGTGSVINMSTLLIKSTEKAVATAPYFTVNWTTRNAYYGAAQRSLPDSKTPVSSYWQIRILGSRNPGDQVRADDYVYLVAQLPPRSLQPEVIRPDPYQRLIRDPKDKNYLTTMAGEWALWRLRPAPPLQN